VLQEFKLPDIGEGIAEGEITRWRVEEGQAVKENDPFVEVMTDKATVEITAPATGTVKSIKAKAGTTVPVGAVIAVLERAGAEAPKAAVAAPSPKAPSSAPAPARGAAAAAPAPARAPAPAPSPEAAPARAPAPVAALAPVARSGNGNGATLVGGRVLAAPAVRRRARELGVDLTQVAGSGPAGRVSQGDLERFMQEGRGASAAAPAGRRAEGPVAPPLRTGPVPAPTPSEATEERLPLRGIRKRIAERMAKSKRTAAHFTYVDEVDVTTLVETREALKPAAAEQGVKLTFMPFIVQATVAALKQFPMLNAMLDDEKQEIVVKHYWHVGFACDTDDGLVVPVVKDADRRSLLNLGAAIQDLSARARAGKLSLDEVTGSTFTITNAGNIGGILATPVINHPEVAILGVHKIADRAVVKNGSIVIRKMMNLSISIDHRVVDGADGARFMNAVIELLQEPRRLLLGAL
jgi:pyruvate dehydrogenase E2 component (dihydrolipoamide acetyltransferase)